MHRELKWPVSKATCLYKKLYMVYSFLYKIIEGTRKIRLSHRLASYLRARFKHFLMSYGESETTSCMQFVAILYISSLRLTIHKKVIS